MQEKKTFLANLAEKRSVLHFKFPHGIRPFQSSAIRKNRKRNRSLILEYLFLGVRYRCHVLPPAKSLLVCGRRVALNGVAALLDEDF